MELILYIIISWFASIYFIIILPKNDLVINIVLYMLLLIFTVSISTVLSLNLGLIEFTQDKVKSVAITLCRNIVTPILLVIFSDIFIQLKTFTKKITSVILILLFTSLMELINLKLGLYTFVKWNLMMCIFLYSFYLVIAVLLNKMLYAFEKRGELNK